MIHGRNLILMADGEVIAYAKACSVDRGTNTIEVCSPVDGNVKKFIPGVREWSASANGLMARKTDVKRLRKMWRDNIPVTIKYKIDDMIEQGQAIIKSLQESGEVGSLAKYSVGFQGSGELDMVFTPVTLSPDDKAEDRHLVCNEQGVWEIYEDDTYSVSVMEYVLNEKTIVRVNTNGKSCLFIHKNTVGRIWECVMECNNKAFMSTADSGYVAHVHQCETELELEAGSYCLTWNAGSNPIVSVNS